MSKKELTSMIEEAVERLKQEGYTSEDIQGALSKMKEETLRETKRWGSLDEYLDTLE